MIDYNPPPHLTEAARCITARQDSGISNHKGEHSAVFVDLNENPQITENARCLHTRMDIGVGKGSHKGERSGVLLEEPRAIINPFKKDVYQNGRRIKEPGEPMFTITVTDRHGIVHRGRIRRLVPKECFRLQGFTPGQFEKVKVAGISDSQLYKLAGNSITVPVVEAIARNLLKFDKEMNAKINRLQQELKRMTRSDGEDETLDQIEMLKDLFEKREHLMTEFEPDVFESIVDRIVVKSRNELEFHLIGGLKLTEKI